MSENKRLIVKNINFSEGMPKICIPVMGATKVEVLASAKEALSSDPDLVEWRADYLEGIAVEGGQVFEAWKDSAKVTILEILEGLRKELGETILVFTLRSKEEGGKSHLELEQYIELNKIAVDSGNVDFIDVEGFKGMIETAENTPVKAGDYVQSLVDYAHEKGVKVIGSKHYFDSTPEQQTMVEVLMALQYAEVDMPKLAVMPKTHGDVARLMDATMEMKSRFADRPIITMSMAEEGRVSRFMGEAFGSAVTFGSVAAASAPGQINAEGLRKLLELVHSEL